MKRRKFKMKLKWFIPTAFTLSTIALFSVSLDKAHAQDVTPSEVDDMTRTANPNVLYDREEDMYYDTRENGYISIWGILVY
jgi:hypothetical protein